MDEWSRATDYNLYFKSYEEKIHTAISNDTKEVREYLNDKDWKGQAKSALRKSLRRFQDDYCLLAMVLFFDEFKLIFDEFIEFVFKAYKIKITLLFLPQKINEVIQISNLKESQIKF